ncbi:CinA family protein [Crenobacter caeni]|uniref:CinA family protein n=1 Tax=Crenobacter caeni TaxID=2705474 RepID=UPI003D7BFBB8
MDEVVRIGDALRARKQTVALAESCTGGLIAAALTDVAGSSDWFGWGFVSYANAAKQAMLGVRAETLATFGAVSRETVLEMAEGARRVASADWGVAVSGIAGPGGGSAGKPVGTVWIAVAGPDGGQACCRLFTGDRKAVRAQTVSAALALLAARLAV